MYVSMTQPVMDGIFRSVYSIEVVRMKPIHLEKTIDGKCNSSN